MLSPMAENSPLISAAARKPPARPSPEATSPIISASSSTERRIWPPVDPIERRSANSPNRSAIVIENVLKMANPPRKAAMKPKANRPSARIPSRSVKPAASALVSLWALRTTSSGESTAAISWISSGVLVPGPALTAMSSTRPSSR